MKVRTMVLATALTLTSSVVLAQTNEPQIPGTEGYGSVVQPSVGSYQTPIGSSNVVPTWRNTGPAATLPRSDTSVQNRAESVPGVRR
jgi:hypothetical protein